MLEKFESSTLKLKQQLVPHQWWISTQNVSTPPTDSSPVGWVEPFGCAQGRLRYTHPAIIAIAEKRERLSPVAARDARHTFRTDRNQPSRLAEHDLGVRRGYCLAE